MTNNFLQDGAMITIIEGQVFDQVMWNGPIANNGNL
jgi:hypothetical protein